MDLFTIGYSGRTLVDFLDDLEDAGVDAVVDVRELPLSRKRGFSKTALRGALAERGIEYVHLRAAGNPYRKLKADIEHCLSLYRDHLDENPDVVCELEEALLGRRGALLCAEAEPACCHRSILVDQLRAKRNVRVTHL